jgi:hypothetical protein
MTAFENILWDVVREYTSDLKEGQQLVRRMKITGVYELALGEYAADADEAKARDLLTDALHDALHNWKENYDHRGTESTESANDSKT